MPSGSGGLNQNRFYPASSVCPLTPARPEGTPATSRWDEFQSQEEVRQIYAAVFPFTTRGYQLEIIGTPLGQQGEFYELAQGLVVSEMFRSPN